ncbi:hypothetical protein OGAPHI_005139 [Ogataea philodendri]|uniref:BHLH domain-containing protein n=1 Tax=Ogataea philodendri TaxID=1378263 RepID=A0A9P8P1Z0_9ASCO|nr:uncharacterized protein OGAPHI_005139 [Ogataea philodendri]KAH3663737.1 hypothetical protein OGAPHI_005139 [Ogataea philodendri]
MSKFEWLDDLQYELEEQRQSFSSSDGYDIDLFDIPNVVGHTPSSITTSPEEEKPDFKPSVKRTKKRRADTSKTKKPMTVRQRKAHNKIERKYRININSKIANLQKLVPWMSNENVAFEIDAAHLEDIPKESLGGRKLNKSMILDIVTKYIEHLRNDNEALAKKVAELEYAMRTQSQDSKL